MHESTAQLGLKGVKTKNNKGQVCTTLQLLTHSADNRDCHNCLTIIFTVSASPSSFTEHRESHLPRSGKIHLTFFFELEKMDNDCFYGRMVMVK